MILTIKDAPKAERKESMWIPGSSEATSEKTIALITKIKRPKENTVSGRVSKSKRGFTVTFKKPNKRAAINAVPKPSILTPSIK